MSKDFYGSMKSVAENVSVTENGMVGYKTTGHSLVDFNFAVASYRGKAQQGVFDFKKVIAEHEPYALKYLFYLRDAREGVGERELFRGCLEELLKHGFENKAEIVDLVIAKAPEYGRWDDLLIFIGTEYEKKVIEVFKQTLKSDCEGCRKGKSISLLAKWLPSENASSKKTKYLAKRIRVGLGASPKAYRKMLSSLRAYLDVTEVKTCANDWASIDYNAVPSKANLKYKNAFLKHDEERRRQFLSKVLSGDKTVKVHMSVGYPHEIVAKYRGNRYSYVNGYDQSLEAYWKGLKQCVGLKDTIVVRDGSGSMQSTIGGTDKVTAMDVSTALAIYCSEHLSGTFKDKFITFSSRAQLVDLSQCGSLHSKLEQTYRHGDCSNTDIQNVFELILNTVVEANRGKKPTDEDYCEVPSTVLIISDMEFDPSRGSGSWYGGGFNGGSNVFKLMDQKFKANGYKLPKLAFWNVASRTKTIPCTTNENGVVLISGFSQNVVSLVMNGKTDPYDALIEELNKERYAEIPLLNFGGTSTDEKSPIRKKTRKEVLAEDKHENDLPDFLF